MSSQAETLRPTRAEIDLSALANNLRVISEAAESAKVFAIVKADAYGHGVLPVAKRLESEGVAGFGVALAEEALELRESGIHVPILILNGVVGDAHRDVIKAELTPVVYEAAEAKRFHQAAKGEPFAIHLKVDTGMGRLGIRHDRLAEFLSELQNCNALRVEGVMTHLASADDDPEFVSEQLRVFDEAVAQIRAAGHSPHMLHVANSAALFRHPESHYDAVRPGISLYGYSGVEIVDTQLKPVLSWRSEIISIRDLQRGESVGYGRTYCAEQPRRIAALPIGYGDGLLRACSNRAQVLIQGKRCPLLGRVSMDLTVADISEVPDAAIGDEVILLGEQGGARIDAAEMASWANTISYEVLTNVSRRVPRFYRD